MALAIEFPQVVWSIEFGGDETVVRQVTMTGGGGAGGGGVTVHNDLTGRSDADTHPISSITGLSAALAAAGNVDSVNGQTGTVSLDLDDLTDVDTTTDPPDADDVLAWDGVTWTPATLTALGAPGLSNANPADLGTAAPGVSTEASRADHVHDMPTAAQVGALPDNTALLALGETSTTAYRGDRGKTAYDHSQVTSGNPHGTTAADVGADPAGTAAGLVDDLSGVSNQATARTNLGLGTAATAATGDFAAASHTHTGSQVTVDASGFNGNLTTSDDTVQEVAQKLDDLVIPAAGIADPGGANDDFLQRKSGVWTNRTVAQVRTDLAVVSGVPVVSSAKVNAAGAYGTPLYEVVNTSGTVTLPVGDMVAIAAEGSPANLTQVGYEITATSATSGQVCQLGCFAVNADGSFGALLWQEDLPAEAIGGAMRTLSTARAVPSLRGWVLLNPNTNAGSVIFRGWSPKPSIVGIHPVYFSRFGFGLQASLSTLPSDLSSYRFGLTDTSTQWGHNNFTSMPALVGVTA